MRLIDADELKEQLFKLKCLYWRAVERRNENYYYLAAIKIVNEQPTIDPVKHGEWEEDGALYKCTNCGHTEGYYDMSYCPECGARMDE